VTRTQRAAGARPVFSGLRGFPALNPVLRVLLSDPGVGKTSFTRHNLRHVGLAKGPGPGVVAVA
jgi:hypothetical protein